MTDVVEIGRSDWIVVVAPGITETIAVPSPTLDLVEFAEQGPAGPKGDTGATGPQGDPGLSGANYVHNQMVPSATWTVTHNLNRYGQDGTLTIIFPEVSSAERNSTSAAISATYETDVNENPIEVTL